jgi:hypothetical protein
MKNNNDQRMIFRQNAITAVTPSQQSLNLNQTRIVNLMAQESNKHSIAGGIRGVKIGYESN